MPAHAPDQARDRTQDQNPGRTAAPEGDPLRRERDHLAASRAALRAMRAEVEALDISDTTANWVSALILEREIGDRIKALADLAHAPLFFGRLDYLHAPGSDKAEGGEGERFYIGRRHVHDGEGDPMVIDWRAPVSQAFYRASKKDPMDVALRRRFGYTCGDLTAYEDEHLTDPAETEKGTASKLLQAEIERPRVGPMRDIVATIQPEQDEIVRAGLSGTVCVQGAPGTGKTAVGLHRVAYLLYAHRERLARTGTLVVGPNRSFLHYIEQVLPALGELAVKQATVDDLVARVEVRGRDTPVAAGLKGDARMAQVLRRAVRSGVTMPAEPCVVVRGSRRWRIPAYELEELVRELLARDIRYEAARAALPQRIAHSVLVRMEAAGEAPDDRVQDAVARNPAVKATVKTVWPQVDPAKLVFRLLSDPGFLAEQAEGLLTAEEQAEILWVKPPRGPKSAKWSAADAVLIDEAADLVERTPSLGHVVLDEAQDLSPMQYRAVGRRCSTGSATVLGDLAQGTTPWATGSWPEALTHLGKPDGRIEELTAGFRVPREVIAYASRLLPAIAPGLVEATSVREAPGSLRIREVGAGELDAALVAACREALTFEGSVGLIAADARIPALVRALSGAGIAHAALGAEPLATPVSPVTASTPAAAPTPGADGDAKLPGTAGSSQAEGSSAPVAAGEEGAGGPRLTLVPASLAKGLEYDYVVLDEPAAVVDGEPPAPLPQAPRRTGLRRLYVALTRAVSGLTVVHATPLPRELAPGDAERPS